MSFRQLREKANMTQSALAKKLGVTSVAINNYERGKRVPNIFTISKLAEILNVQIEEVVKCFDKSRDKVV